MPTQLPNVFIRKGISFDGLNFHLSCPLKRPKTWIEARECDALFVMVFKKPLFHLFQQEEESFKNESFLKSLSWAFFGRFSVDDKQKRTKTYGPVI